MGLEWYWWIVVGVFVLICLMAVNDVRNKRGIKEKKEAAAAEKRKKNKKKSQRKNKKRR